MGALAFDHMSHILAYECRAIERQPPHITGLGTEFVAGLLS
jgi:hypothetical protein